MGSVQSRIVASLAACSVYFVYVHIYCSHTLLKTNVLNSDRLPSFVYLYMKYLTKALSRRTGCLYTTNKCEVVYTILNCRWARSTSVKGGGLFKLSAGRPHCESVYFVSTRLETPLLRRFCSAAGYGWDYPDTEFRDIPLCFPEFLCRRLLLLVLTDGHFRLSPAGRAQQFL